MEAKTLQPPKGHNIVFTILGFCFLLGFMIGLWMGFALAAQPPIKQVGEWELECINDATFPGVRCYGYCGEDQPWNPLDSTVEEPK